MTQTELSLYNAASAAAVRGSRIALARALRALHSINRDATKRALYHASFVGWPTRIRPNGRYN